MSNDNALLYLKSYKVSTFYQLCVLAIIVLSIYYPSIFAEISFLDDKEAIDSLFNLEQFDLKSLFFPRSHDGGYYRPFLVLSYIIDRFVWDLEPKIMHFENVLMHLANTLMIYWVAKRLCKQNEQTENMKSMLPLLGAALFALHPINTESINWISGRTDPMACMFVLAALLLVVMYRQQQKPNILLLLAAVIMMICGVLSKEVALGFIPASVFILLAKNENSVDIPKPAAPVISKPLVVFCFYISIALLQGLMLSNYYLVVATGVAYLLHLIWVTGLGEPLVNFRQKFRSLILVCAAFGALVVLFYGLRKVAYVSDTSKVSNTLQVLFADMNYSIQLFIGAAGFYVKKFFVPPPLNLAIREIDPLYELFGVLCFMGAVYLVYLRRIASALIIGGFMMLSPAFPLVFGTFAWTAYAERYVYIPSAFWIIGSVAFLNEFLLKVNDVFKKSMIVIGVAILSIFAVITFKRNVLWQTNVGIFKDSVDKSPEFKNVRGIYITSLVDKNKYEEAERQLLIAKKIKTLVYDERYDLLYASILSESGRFDEAESVYAEIKTKTAGTIDYYESLISYYTNRLFKAKDQASFIFFTKKKVEAYEKLYALNKSAFTSYRLGQAYIAVGDRDNALRMVEIAANSLKSEDPLKRNAEVLLKRIRSGKASVPYGF